MRRVLAFLGLFITFFSLLSQNNLCLSPINASFAVGVIPYKVQSSDLNNDGSRDFICALNYGSFAVTLSNGSGNYYPPAYYQVVTSGFHSLDFEIADFNNDGNQDMALTDTNTAGIRILLGNNNGVFTSTLSYPCGPKPNVFKASDFNGDGIPDLAVVNYVSNGFSVLINNGSGSFSTPNFIVSNKAERIFAEDFNNDGKTDLLVIRDSSKVSTIYKGIGNGAFTAISSYSFGYQAGEIITGDFNSDNKRDIACVSTGSTVSIVKGNGACTFTSSSVYTVSPYIGRICSGDLNSDGRTDILTLSGGPQDFSILLANNSGSFFSPVDFSNVFDSTSCTYSLSHFYAAITDMNGDGKVDVLLGPDNCQAIFTMTNCNTVDVGLIERKPSISLKMYPNPASDFVTFSIPSHAPTFSSIIIYNTLGQIVKRQSITESAQIDIKDLDAGYYGVTIDFQGKILNKKLLISR